MSNSEWRIWKFGGMFALVLLFFIVQPVGCNRIDAGKVGIKINLYGQQRGVDDIPLITGMALYSRYTQEVHEFPTYMQNVTWSTNQNGIDESITFNSSEGANFNADIALSYTLKAEKVPHIFIKYRQDIDIITRTNLRNKVREAFTTNASKYSATELFGEKKNEFLSEVKKMLVAEMEPDGFMIDLVTIVGSIRAEQKVMDSINAVIQANQRALEAENKVKQSEAEAKQKIAEAEGEAQSILRVAESQAQANKLITESITPQLVQYKMIERWDGIAPKVLGSDSGLLLNVDMK